VIKLTDKLRERGVYNSWEFYGNEVYISFRANQGSRDVLPSRWNVRKPGTSLSDAWYDNGCKSFGGSGRKGAAAGLEEAKKWASKEFGIKEWARDPYGSWGEAGYVKRRIKELTKAASE
jgi:hypothetical protein